MTGDLHSSLELPTSIALKWVDGSVGGNYTSSLELSTKLATGNV